MLDLLHARSSERNRIVGLAWIRVARVSLSRSMNLQVVRVMMSMRVLWVGSLS